jgi:hypothetical protein
MRACRTPRRSPRWRTGTGGRTTLTLLVQHASRENRDRHLEYGDSLQQALDLLERAALSGR